MASLDKEKLEEMRGKIRKNPGYVRIFFDFSLFYRPTLLIFSNLPQVIRETKAGGLEALSVLSLRDSIENLPREHHIPALHALVANIGSPDILDDADELSDVFYIHLRTQLATLDGIGWISELIKDGVYEEEMTKALLSHWRIIYKCLTMLWKKEVQKIWDTFEVAEGSHTRLAIYARVMDTYLMPRDLARIVLRDTTVLDFVFGMWLWESELPTKYLDFWVSAALNNCFQFEGRPGDVFLARVLELAGDARRVARYATTRLRVAFKYIDKHEEFPIIHDLDVACTLCFNDAMRSEILRLNGEPIVTKITLKVSGMVKDLAVVQRNEELMNVGCVIYVCFRFLNMTMDTEGGHVWICQALRAGLLQIIVNICPRLTTLNLPMDPSLSTFIKHTLGDFLPRFLMFKSVINAVILATKQLKLDEITEHVYSDREIPKFWDFYGRVVLDRLVTKLVFNHLSSGVYGSFCDNVSVDLMIACTTTLIQKSYSVPNCFQRALLLCVLAAGLRIIVEETARKNHGEKEDTASGVEVLVVCTEYHLLLFHS